LRIARDLTQQELSKLTGLSREEISEYENGRRRVTGMDAGMILKMARALRVPIKLLLS
jgi:transcriptional regulator with XRE-family HTH domain